MIVKEFDFNRTFLITCCFDVPISMLVYHLLDDFDRNNVYILQIFPVEEGSDWVPKSKLVRK